MVAKESNRNRNNKLYLYSRIIKYLIKRGKTPDKYHFDIVELPTSRFDIIKKKVNSDGVYKKFIKKEIIFIEGRDNFRNIILRIPKLTRMNNGIGELDAHLRVRSESKKEIGIITDMHFEPTYFNNYWLNGVNEKRTNAYESEHKAVHNTPQKL